jgi:hypothetical protein
MNSRTRVWAFGGALFLSAALLFSLQPMISKMLLPILGGSPAVWTTAMVFFQGALLAGYLYAFLSARYLPMRSQVVAHVLLLSSAILLLPVSAPATTAGLDLAAPQGWLLWTLFTGIGLPFVAIAGTSTLLQSWFQHSGHGRSSDPYFLYAASNSGSLLALVAYPAVAEPLFKLSELASGWAIGYLGLIVIIGRSGLMAWRQAQIAVVDLSPGAMSGEAEGSGSLPVSVGQRLEWVFLAFVPAVMLLGITLHITMDVASVPLLWVAPLAVYLLTFVLTFARPGAYSGSLTRNLQAVALILLALLTLPGFTWNLGINLVVLFFSGMVCHGTLARLRPAASQLPEYYLWIAFGGFLGGLSAGLIAPLVFDRVLEYPIGIVLACLARGVPWGRASLGSRRQWLVVVVLTVGYLAGLSSLLGNFLPALAVQIGMLAAAGAGLYFVRKGTLPFALLIGALIVNAQLGELQGLQPLHRERSFFGVHRVMIEPGSNAYLLFNGTTLHGGQWLDPRLKSQPMNYYYRAGPVGDLIPGFRQAHGIDRAVIVGLGAGALACYFQGDEQLTFIELDPTVVRIASDPRYFSFLKDCGNQPVVEVGDGRLKLGEAPDGYYDLIFLDAFSSDSVPVHLLTEEALSLYVRKLSPAGMLVFNLSNRHLQLSPVLARLTRTLRLAAVMRRYKPSEAEKMGSATGSLWAAVARDPANLEFLSQTGRWQPIEAGGVGDLWTDDYSSLLGPMRARRE